MSSGIAGMVTEIKYARSDRKHSGKHHASGQHALAVKRYNRAMRKAARHFIAEQG